MKPLGFLAPRTLFATDLMIGIQLFGSMLVLEERPVSLLPQLRRLMIAPSLLEYLRAVYKTYLDADDFRRSYVESDADTEEASITSFRSLLLVCLPPHPDKPKREFTSPVTSLDITVAELMGANEFIKGEKSVPASEVVYELFCLAAVPAVLDDALVYGVDVKRDTRSLLQESHSSSLPALRALMAAPERTRELADVFYQDLITAWAGRSLHSFFVRSVNKDGYLTWWPEAKTHFGRPLPVREIRTALGTVFCDVRSYEDEGADGAVRAYEWAAELREEQSSELPDAVAYGMAYVFERDEVGLPYGGVDDLVIAADCVADTDVLQVGAFFDQHEDAEALLEESDVCFVWLWERRDTGPKGAGAECLRAAVQDLKRRFPQLRLVVVDAKPAQFLSWTDGVDYPQVELAKQEAIESVLNHLDTLDLGSIVKGEVRHILNNVENDPAAAQRVFETAMVSGGAAYEDDDLHNEFKMVCGIWVTPDLSRYKRGEARKPLVCRSAVDFGLLHGAIETLFPAGPDVLIQVPNDTVDLDTVEMRNSVPSLSSEFKYCRDFGKNLLRLAHVDTSEVLNIQPVWKNLQPVQNRNSASPPVLIMFAVTADDFDDAMIWFGSACTSFGLAPPDLSDETEYDGRGKLPPKFRYTLQALFGCDFREECIFDRICTDPPPGY